MLAKRTFDAADGVQLKHIVISFGTKLNLPWKKIRKLTLRTIGQWKERYQMFYGMHYEVNDEGKGYWRLAGTTTLSRAISNKRLAQAGYYSILDRYESLHLCD